MLEYDRRTDRFVGACYAVPASCFLAGMRRLVAGGSTLSQALTQLLDEASWSAETPGVEALLTPAAALAEAQAILQHDPPA